MYSKVSGNIHYQEVPLNSLSICWYVPLSKNPLLLEDGFQTFPHHFAAGAEVCKTTVVAIHLKESCIHWEWNNCTSFSYCGPIFINIALVAVHPIDNAISTYHHFWVYLLHPELDVNDDKGICNREDCQNLMALVIFPKERTVRRSSICSSGVLIWSTNPGAEGRLQFLPALCTMTVLGTANLANFCIN